MYLRPGWHGLRFDPAGFPRFDDLWRAYVRQVEYLGGLTIMASHFAGAIQKQRGHCPLMSSLLVDCLKRRRDMVFGARYSLSGIGVFGNSNVYDGLMAIRRRVCDEKRLTWGELREALVTDFGNISAPEEDAGAVSERYAPEQFAGWGSGSAEGDKTAVDEAARLSLANCEPRFGNGRTEVDDLANTVNAVHAELCAKHVDARNGRFTCGIWPVEGHVHSGYMTAATPDGRRRGTPIADGVGACHAADRSGPTALLRSVARLDHAEHWPAGNTCNIKFSKSSMSDEAGIARMRDLATAFMELGGQQLQINVVDADTLRDAQAHPEEHADLIVRVAGFSAYFTTLGVDTQNEIIMRTEQP